MSCCNPEGGTAKEDGCSCGAVSKYITGKVSGRKKYGRKKDRPSEDCEAKKILKFGAESEVVLQGLIVMFLVGISNLKGKTGALGCHSLVQNRFPQ